MAQNRAQARKSKRAAENANKRQVTAGTSAINDKVNRRPASARSAKTAEQQRENDESLDRAFSILAGKNYLRDMISDRVGKRVTYSKRIEGRCLICGHNGCMSVTKSKDKEFAHCYSTNCPSGFGVPHRSKAGRSGDALEFLMHVDGLTYGEACMALRDEAGVQFVPVCGKRQEGKELDAIAPSLEVSLAVNGRGDPLQTTENHMRVLQGDALLAGRFRFNTLANSIWVFPPIPWDESASPRRLVDADFVGFHMYCERHYGLIKKQAAIDALEFVANQLAFDPRVDWLNGLRWDGVHRAENMLSWYLGADNSDYNKAVSALMFSGAVARAFEPGCKFDYMPIFQGPQGLGKSKFISRMAIDPQWLNDNYGTFDGENALYGLMGVWIVEVAELAAVRKTKDKELLKARITSTQENYRPKYGRVTIVWPMTHIFIGTTNSKSFLSDSTGNRRFLPVECGVVAPSRSLWGNECEHDFKQAYAEAVERWSNGEVSLLMPEHLSGEVLAQQQAYTIEDQRASLIYNYLEAVAQRENAFDRRVCIPDIAENALGMERKDYLGKRTFSNEITDILDRAEGWARTKTQTRFKPYGKNLTWVPVD